MKKKEDLKFVPFEDLIFDLEPVLYDSKVEQVVPFPVTQRTPKGTIEVRLAHKLKPLSDERFFQREKEFLANEKKSLESNEPTKKLWRDLVLDRYGYQTSDNWKDTTPYNHQLNAVAGILHINLINERDEEVLADEYLFSDEELTCLRFHVLFGGVPLEDWQTWLTSGHFPSNIQLSSEQYLTVVSLVRRGISPNVLLEIQHYYKQETSAQMNEFRLILEGKPRKGVLASAAKVNEETRAERLFALAEGAEVKTQGYKSHVPAWFRIAAVESFFFLQVADLGKSLTS